MAKKVPVKYTSREFESIKADLVDYIKRYYPSTYKDFNEAGFGSMVLDTVAYIGDQLSFYLDYQANETFLDTAVEYDNILRLSKQYGYKYPGSPSAYGELEFYVLLPANTNGIGVNWDYAPILRRGSMFGSTAGNNFMLIADVDFKNTNNEVVVGRVNEDTGVPTYYAVRARGRCISGELARETIAVGPFKKFLKIDLSARNVAEIVGVSDLEGNEYYEVPYLSQNIIYRDVVNRGSDRDEALSIMKAVPVARRYVVERDRNRTSLQFGYGSDNELTTNSVIDPSNVVLEMHGRDYTSEREFDPNKLMSTDKFGIAPSDTTLLVRYRVNSSENTNAAANSVTEIVTPDLKFENITSLSDTELSVIASSLEVTNERPITGDIVDPSIEEIRVRSLDTFATQHRAVTKQDYVAMTYMMPPKFGAVKRCNVVQDKDSLKRNINMYVISESSAGRLVTTATTIKNNLKTWINRNKMINDTVDILDAKVLNIGIDFEIIADLESNKFGVIADAQNALIQEFTQTKADIGEPFSISRIYKALRKVRGVLDVVKVDVDKKIGSAYADYRFDMDMNTSPDKRMILLPEDAIWEIKYPGQDIRGALK